MYNIGIIVTGRIFNTAKATCIIPVFNKVGHKCTEFFLQPSQKKKIHPIHIFWEIMGNAFVARGEYYSEKSNKFLPPFLGVQFMPSFFA